MTLRHFMLATVASCAFAASAQAGPIADYGDAPDGPYPSLHNSPNAAPGLNSPFHLDVSKEWLGSATITSGVSTTTFEADSKQVDLDEDDSGAAIFLLNSERGYISTSLSLNRTDTSVRYLNAVIDLDGNGDWGDVVGASQQREWVIRNMPIDPTTMTSAMDPDNDDVVNLNVYAGFHLDPSFVAEQAWTRLTLSTEPVPLNAPLAEWDGSGPVNGFARGETEDFFAVVEAATQDDNGVFNGPGPGGQPGNKNVGPLAIRWVPYAPAIDGQHARTPAAPDPAAPVGEFRFNASAAAADPANAFGGNALLGWVRVCDIGFGDCTHLANQGPNSPIIALPAAGMVLGGAAVGLLPLVQGLNQAVVTAQFPRKINGDTHTFLFGFVDPPSSFYMTIEMDDCLLYPSGSGCLFTAAHFITTPEPAALGLLGLGLAALWRLRRFAV